MSEKKFRPMLSATVTEVAALRFPLLASHKLDGIRALVLGGVVVSRNLKPIPNRHVQALFGRREYEGLDGGPALPDLPGRAPPGRPLIAGPHKTSNTVPFTE